MHPYTGTVHAQQWKTYNLDDFVSYSYIHLYLKPCHQVSIDESVVLVVDDKLDMSKMLSWTSFDYVVLI